MNRRRRRHHLVVGLAVGVLGAGWFVRPRRVVIVGPSMEPTLVGGDRLVVVKGLGGPRTGDIVAVADPRGGGRLLVKRVVSVEGDEVEVEGDNPRSSTDSRSFGPVRRRTLVGRAVYRYFPADRAGLLRGRSRRATGRSG